MPAPRQERCGAFAPCVPSRLRIASAESFQPWLTRPCSDRRSYSMKPSPSRSPYLSIQRERREGVRPQPFDSVVIARPALVLVEQHQPQRRRARSCTSCDAASSREAARSRTRLLRHGRRHAAVAHAARRVRALDRRSRLVESLAERTGALGWIDELRRHRRRRLRRVRSAVRAQGLVNQGWKDSGDVDPQPRRHARRGSDRAGRGAGLRLRAHGAAWRVLRDCAATWSSRRPRSTRPTSCASASKTLLDGGRGHIRDGPRRQQAARSTGSPRTPAMRSGPASPSPSAPRATARAAHRARHVERLGHPHAVGRDGGYNPIGYHLGTSGRTTTRICAAGFARYGSSRGAPGRRRAARGDRSTSRSPPAGAVLRLRPRPRRCPCPIRWPARPRPGRQVAVSPDGGDARPAARRARQAARAVRPALPGWLPELRLRRLRVGEPLVDLLVRRADGIDPSKCSDAQQTWMSSSASSDADVRADVGERLDAAGSETPRLDAELPLGHVLRVDRATFSPEGQSSVRRRRANSRDSWSACERRTGGVPPRPQGIPRPRAQRGPAGADPAARDRDCSSTWRWAPGGLLTAAPREAERARADVGRWHGERTDRDCGRSRVPVPRLRRRRRVSRDRRFPRTPLRWPLKTRSVTGSRM